MLRNAGDQKSRSSVQPLAETTRQTQLQVFGDATRCGFRTRTGSDADNFSKSQGVLAARGSSSEEMRLTENACGKAELKLGQIAEGPVVVIGMKCLPTRASGVECGQP